MYTRIGKNLRQDFPVFMAQQRSRGSSVQPLVYLDSAATAQKPKIVIDTLADFFANHYGTVHRGAYALSGRASERYEATRSSVAKLVSPLATSDCVVFTHGATEGLNLLANGLGTMALNAESRIVATVAEHHANLVPWQQAALKYDCELAYLPLKGSAGPDLALDLDKARKLITPNTKIVTLASVGNVLGQVNPLREIAQMAKAVGAWVVIDAAQSISCMEDDLFALGADAVVFSAHKMYGPTGVGAVVARRQLLCDMPPLMFGGGMISSVTLEESTWAPAPAKFEAGTPPIAEVIGWAAACDWLFDVGRKNIHHHSAALATQFRSEIEKIPGMQVYSPNSGNETLVSFRHNRVHAHDLATMLDACNVAVRAGHHCAWPLVQFLGVDALVRASFAAYSDEDDVGLAVKAIREACLRL